MRVGILCFMLGVITLGVSVPSDAHGQTTSNSGVFAIRELTLKEGASTQEFERYFAAEYTPPREAAVPGLLLYLIKGDRGERKNQYLMVWEFDSVTRRNEYFPVEGGDPSERLLQLLRPVTPHRLGDYVEIGTPTDYVVLRQRREPVRNQH